MSYLTESIGELETEVVAGLAGEGFTFNRKTETRSQFYARALGDSTAYLRKPLAQLAAELNSEFGGSVKSHLTQSYAQLLDDLDTTLDEGGGGDVPPEPPEGFTYLINDEDKYLVNADDNYILSKVS